MTDKTLSCAACGVKSCRRADEASYPEFCPTKQMDPALLREAMQAYEDNPELGKMARVSASIEGEFYGDYSRVEETVEFIKRMGYTKIGVATCVGLLNETRIFSKILTSEGIEHYVVGCKLGAQDKSVVGVPEDKKLNGGGKHESMCNPILQAKALAAWGAELNILVGLCVGHDAQFISHATAPTTVLIVKDRRMGHNPVAALYHANTGYTRFKKLLKK